ncbi:ACP S-malonyltransferase [Candidatus Thioglobus sp.]|nr:ACP S-malonyltransferase [Candidatus Thioglobus sp.]
MKYSIVFPGQGSQSLGMLSDLRSNFSVVNEIFQEASDAINLDLWKIVNEDQELLNLTENTQPVMLAAGYATYKVLASEVSLTPISIAGHSLGEYTALVASGSLSFFEAVKLVKKRAELMQAAVPSGLGSMAAILGLDDTSVIEICLKASDKGVVEAVNFNSPGQVVIAGEKDAVAHACELMKEAGAKRALVLPVSVPSHCSLMKDAAMEYKYSVDNINFQMGSEKVIHNVDGDYSSNIDEIKSKLVEQLHKPVLWTSIVQKMKESGVEKLIEAGPGKVLAGLTRRIDKSLSGSAIIDTTSLRATIEEISNA